MNEKSVENRVRVAVDQWRRDPCKEQELAETARIEKMTGDASNRIYARVTFGSTSDRDRSAVGDGDERDRPSSAVAMILPLEPRPAEEFGSPAEGAERLPFIEMASWLRERGVPVPDLYHFDADGRVLLLEDLGDETFERALESGDVSLLYDRAVDLLVDFQWRTRQPESSLIAAKRRFERDVYAWELQHYVEWRLEADLNVPPGPWKAELTRAFEPLLDELCDLPERLVHRDFQSRNLMLVGGKDLRLIDFQDALMGPYIYDLVALLRDSYVALPNSEVDRLVSRYMAKAREAGVFDTDLRSVERAFRLVTVQRKLKDTGRFVFIDRIKKNPSFLPYRAPSMAYVRSALDALTGYETLRSFIAELDPE